MTTRNYFFLTTKSNFKSIYTINNKNEDVNNISICMPKIPKTDVIIIGTVKE